MLSEQPPEPLGAATRPLPPVHWRDRAADLVALGAGRPVLAGVVVVLLLGAVLVLGPMVRGVASEPTNQPVEAALPMAGSATSTTLAGTAGATASTALGSAVAGAAAVDPAAAPVVVHAAGAVVDAGVYELPAGSRVDDLVSAAGGLAPDADGDRVNLALLLADGERVYVPRVGEEVVPEAPSPSGAAAGSPSAEGGGSGAATSGPINLNTATVAELETLPGVGPVTAQAIVDHREQEGPFTSVDDLLDVQGIGEARLAQMREQVTV